MIFAMEMKSYLNH